MSRTAPAPIRIAPPPDGWAPVRPMPRGPSRARSKDRPVAAMVFGILSLVFNPLVLPSLIGILYGARSLQAGTARRAQAIVGIVCGSIGAGLTLLWIVIAVVGRLLLPGVQAAALEESIHAAAAGSGVSVSAVHCPPVRSFEPGESVTCTAVLGDGGSVSVVATASDAGPASLRFVQTA